MVVRNGLVLAVLVATLAGASGAAAAAPQELTIPAADGTPLACGLVEPDGAPPAGGWPGVLLFHGLGGTHLDLEPLATQVLAPAGYASLMCDARGQGASGGLFGLDGPVEVADARTLFDWLAARPEVSDTAIGGIGLSLGGGVLWNAALAGVPFAAIVPAISWTSLLPALAPQGLPKTGLVQALAGSVAGGRWDPTLLAGLGALTSGTSTGPAAALAAARSPAPRLGALAVPTLLLQGRHDFLFDESQATAAFAKLAGPKRLYLGDLGHPPGASPTAAPDAATFSGEAVRWLDRYLKGVANGVDAEPPVELAHDPWDGETTSYPGLPPTKVTSVSLPGRTSLHGDLGVVRGARITGGPHETFGSSTVTVRYSDAAGGWDRLVAVLSVAGSATPIAEGGDRITAASGVATIKLAAESVVVPAGKRLVLRLGATSGVQTGVAAVYVDPVPASASITVDRATLGLSVLKRAVSR